MMAWVYTAKHRRRTMRVRNGSVVEEEFSFRITRGNVLCGWYNHRCWSDHLYCGDSWPGEEVICDCPGSKWRPEE